MPERAGVLNVPRVVFTTAGLSRAPKGRQEGPPARVPARGEQRARRWPRGVSGCLWSGRQRRPRPAEQAGRWPRSSVSPRRPLAVSHLHPRGGPGGEEPLFVLCADKPCWRAPRRLCSSSNSTCHCHCAQQGCPHSALTNSCSPCRLNLVGREHPYRARRRKNMLRLFIFYCSRKGVSCSLYEIGRDLQLTGRLHFIVLRRYGCCCFMSGSQGKPFW